MRSSYSEEDVILLLKDITGLVEPQPAKVREKLIQSGKHYSEMLPVEYVPTDQYMQVYHNALKHYAKPVANAVGMLADKIIENKGKKIVLVSLARAGIPIGILVKRYIKFKYGINVPHYSISIIRGRGIDDNAMKYLLEKYRPQQILFVDGWIGKGAILNELPQTGTMIQLFLYIFKSNACETHPRKAFISNHILYICYICTKKEADKFIHHLLLS